MFTQAICLFVLWVVLGFKTISVLRLVFKTLNLSFTKRGPNARRAVQTLPVGGVLARVVCSYGWHQPRRFASTAMWADEEIVLAAVADQGRAFKYAASVLRETKAFVLRALQVGGNLEF